MFLYYTLLTQSLPLLEILILVQCNVGTSYSHYQIVCMPYLLLTVTSLGHVSLPLSMSLLPITPSCHFSPSHLSVMSPCRCECLPKHLPMIVISLTLVRVISCHPRCVLCMAMYESSALCMYAYCFVTNLVELCALSQISWPTLSSK